MGLGGAAYLAAALGTVEVDVGRVLEGLPRGLEFLAGFAPPDFVSRGDMIVAGVFESIWMTLASTAVGIVVSIPVALGAASNLAPGPVYIACRALIAASRSFQEVILAVFAVAMFGFGPFAGFVTLVVATVGFFAKLLRRRHRGHRPGPSRSDPSHRSGLGLLGSCGRCGPRSPRASWG